jgi:hypothetical protein
MIDEVALGCLSAVEQWLVEVGQGDAVAGLARCHRPIMAQRAAPASGSPLAVAVVTGPGVAARVSGGRRRPHSG